jgi:hypothetical protein
MGPQSAELRTRRIESTGRARWVNRLRVDVLVPVLAVAVLFGLVLGNRLSSYHGNASGFALFGTYFRDQTRAPPGAVFNSQYGYDGQFFYLQAKDPLLLHDATVTAFRHSIEAFRMQRVAYPALAWLFAAGQRGALPWSMLAINAAVALLITAGFAAYARRRGWSGWWALAIGFMCGLLTGALRDLSDPLAVSAMLGGLLLWQQRRRGWAAALLALGALAREPMMLAVVAIAADAAARWWRERARGRPEAWREITREAWPVVVIPVAGYLGWQLYVSARYGGSVASAGTAFKPPVVGLLDELRHALDAPQSGDMLWDLAYLGLITLGVVASVDLLRRRVSTASVAATLFGLSLLILVFGDPWSYTRLSMPMFAALLLGGLEQRSRPALLVCVAAAALTVVVPFAPWLGSG